MRGKLSPNRRTSRSFPITGQDRRRQRANRIELGGIERACEHTGLVEWPSRAVRPLGQPGQHADVIVRATARRPRGRPGAWPARGPARPGPARPGPRSTRPVLSVCSRPRPTRARHLDEGSVGPLDAVGVLAVPPDPAWLNEAPA
jgi:hypothetical protein